MCLAIPGKILDCQVHGGFRTGRVQFGGIERLICLDFVPEAQVGDFVMVHVGFAISVVNREEAERTYQVLQAMGVLEEELHLTEQEGAVEGTTIPENPPDRENLRPISADALPRGDRK